MGVRGGDAAYLEVLTVLPTTTNAVMPSTLMRVSPLSVTSSPYCSYLAQNKTSTNRFETVYNVNSKQRKVSTTFCTMLSLNFS